MDWAIFFDEIAYCLSGDGNHVLSGCVTCGVFEVQVDVVTFYSGSYVYEFSVRSSGIGYVLEYFEFLHGPGDKFSSIS